MAHRNAASLVKQIPECVAPCFNLAVGATGCEDEDYDCWCYAKNHQTIVDTQEECLINRQRKLSKFCTDDEMHQMELSYWKICEQYWEPYGTATEPATIKTTSSSSTKTTLSSTTSTSISDLPETTAESTTAEPSTAESTTLESTTFESAPATAEPSAEPVIGESGSGTSSSHKLSGGEKAGIAVGVVFGVTLIGIAVFLWLRERRKRRGLEKQLADARDVSSSKGIVWDKNTYEMEGDRPHCEELPVDMRTPEMNSAVLHMPQNAQNPLRGLSTSPDPSTLAEGNEQPRSS